MSLFDNALRFARMLNPDYQPGTIEPQKRPTSIPMRVLRDRFPVTLKIGYQPTPHYRRDGELRKHQPKYVEPGSLAYVRLECDGNLKLYPFAMAGTGYEIVHDAIEGEHFEFDVPAIERELKEERESEQRRLDRYGY